jgi:hypothetical protein
MKKAVATVFLFTISVHDAAASGTPTYRECVEMGIQYYKDIGSYPKLSTGEDALEKVMSMCTNSPFAFGAKK